MEGLTGIFGEQVALDFETAFVQQKVGDYTILGNPADLQVPEKFKAVIRELGDDKPMFVTVAVPIGRSRVLTSNNNPAEDKPHRLWPESVMDTLVARIRESGLPGYRGHYPELESVPDTSTLWVAATKGEKPTGERAVLARGYVFNVSNNRQYIKAGAFNTVSPMAMSRVRPEVDQGDPVMLVEQANWLSLDWVRPNTEGIRGAEVISTEGAKSGMLLTPEQRKLITELGLSTLEELNPLLVAEIAKSASTTPNNTKDNEIIVSLTNRVQELTREVATLAVEKSVLEQVATTIGCKPTELVGKITELKALQMSAAQIACEAAIAKLGNSPFRDVVAKRLKDKQFGSPKEAEEAVAAEVATAKEYVAVLGNQLDLGGVKASGNSGGTGTGVLSAYGNTLAGRTS